MNGTEVLFEELCSVDIICNATDDAIVDNSVVQLNTPGTVANGGAGIELSITQKRLMFLKEELSGLTLNVTFMDDFPLSYKDTSTGKPKGVAIDILEFLMEKFNFTYVLVTPEKNIMGSSEQYAGSIMELLDTEVTVWTIIDSLSILPILRRWFFNDVMMWTNNFQRADVAASFLPIMTDPNKHIYYSSVTLDEGEWVMMMRRPQESATGNGLLAPFSMDVWILILISLLLVGPILYFLVLFRSRFTKGKHFDQPMYSMPHCVWFVYGALMKQGSVLSPTGDSTRLLFATWWIFITILTSFYTANLTAFLTLSQFTLPINNAHDIFRKEKRFVAHQGGAVEYAIKNVRPRVHFWL